MGHHTLDKHPLHDHLWYGHICSDNILIFGWRLYFTIQMYPYFDIRAWVNVPVFWYPSMGKHTCVSISEHGQTYPCFDIQVQASIPILRFAQKKKKNTPMYPLHHGMKTPVNSSIDHYRSCKMVHKWAQKCIFSPWLVPGVLQMGQWDIPNRILNLQGMSHTIPVGCPKAKQYKAWDVPCSALKNTPYRPN
jgi:hypothetical protein